MTIGAAICWMTMPLLACYAVYGASRWRRGGDQDLNVALMGAIAPLAYLLAGKVDAAVLTTVVVAGLAITVAWRIQLLRRSRADGGLNREPD